MHASRKLLAYSTVCVYCAGGLQGVCQDVSVGAVQRWQLLQAAADMLPGEVQAAHAAEVLTRHHQEHLQPHVLRQVLQHSSLELPDAVSSHHDASGAQLVALYAGPQLDRCCRRSMPYAMSFYQYWQLLVRSDCAPPNLEPKASVLRVVEVPAA